MIKKLLALFSALLCASAHAGYAQAVPPSGWSPGTYAVSANDAAYGRVIYAPNGPTTNVAGQAVKMPAAYRFAANAPRIAAGVIFANPYVRTGIAIASWLNIADVVWDEARQFWAQKTPPISGVQWTNGAGGAYAGPFATYLEAANALRQYFAAGGSYTSGVYCNKINDLAYDCSFGNSNIGSRIVSGTPTGPATCPVGWTFSSVGCLSPQLDQPKFLDLLNPNNQIGWPMPPRVPFELPSPTPLPIEPLPFINPEPGPEPVPRPRFVPSGDPVPNPQFNPDAPPGPNNQPYIQPGTRIVPSPTTSQPWRVDLQPVNRPQAEPTPNPNPDAEPGINPSDKPDEDQDLCVKNPDIAACENGDINDVALPEVPKLYERKYPDGLIGIWNQKSDQIKQTSAFTLAAQLMPTGLVSGTCPSWPLALDFSWWASYGEFDVAPPCWIWDVAKTIIIISALMLARSLIFGG